ncbi:hypothetical protein L198_02085 [Cryptococcus wingfieldii CBS 7118]|uniref:Uncharacterized protein n=1 Tax=Cryptococcus wingfieldii CBS 7118 TaxID=1295528 RepID=A0A1E3JZR6_9TREE|nr:hypothetical protein L198_02085 [Cryptococcus wingfieldii CBS 7118]ODO05392.1 hypothetical protein L198_02085 [Cryptococcus wingfieldii CBS 7118]
MAKEDQPHHEPTEPSAISDAAQHSTMSGSEQSRARHSRKVAFVTDEGEEDEYEQEDPDARSRRREKLKAAATKYPTSQEERQSELTQLTDEQAPTAEGEPSAASARGDEEWVDGQKMLRSDIDLIEVVWIFDVETRGVVRPTCHT